MYLCTVAGDWPQALQRLAKSDVAEIADAAAAELPLAHADSPHVQAVFDVGERWWRVAESLPDADDSRAFRNHVVDLYARVSDQVTDPLDRALIDQRRKQAAR